MIDVQREIQSELKREHTELRAELNTLIERNTQLLRTEIKADAEYS